MSRLGRSRPTRPYSAPSTAPGPQFVVVPTATESVAFASGWDASADTPLVNTYKTENVAFAAGWAVTADIPLIKTHTADSVAFAAGWAAAWGSIRINTRPPAESIGFAAGWDATAPRAKIMWFKAAAESVGFAAGWDAAITYRRTNTFTANAVSYAAGWSATADMPLIKTYVSDAFAHAAGWDDAAVAHLAFSMHTTEAVAYAQAWDVTARMPVIYTYAHDNVAHAAGWDDRAQTLLRWFHQPLDAISFAAGWDATGSRTLLVAHALDSISHGAGWDESVRIPFISTFVHDTIGFAAGWDAAARTGFTQWRTENVAFSAGWDVTTKTKVMWWVAPSETISHAAGWNESVASHHLYVAAAAESVSYAAGWVVSGKALFMWHVVPYENMAHAAGWDESAVAHKVFIITAPAQTISHAAGWDESTDVSPVHIRFHIEPAMDNSDVAAVPWLQRRLFESVGYPRGWDATAGAIRLVTPPMVVESIGYAQGWAVTPSWLYKHFYTPSEAPFSGDLVALLATHYAAPAAESSPSTADSGATWRYYHALTGESIAAGQGWLDNAGVWRHFYLTSSDAVLGADAATLMLRRLFVPSEPLTSYGDSALGLKRVKLPGITETLPTAESAAIKRAFYTSASDGLTGNDSALLRTIWHLLPAEPLVSLADSPAVQARRRYAVNDVVAAAGGWEALATFVAKHFTAYAEIAPDMTDTAARWAKHYAGATPETYGSLTDTAIQRAKHWQAVTDTALTVDMPATWRRFNQAVADTNATMVDAATRYALHRQAVTDSQSVDAAAPSMWFKLSRLASDAVAYAAGWDVTARLAPLYLLRSTVESVGHAAGYDDAARFITYHYAGTADSNPSNADNAQQRSTALPRATERIAYALNLDATVRSVASYAVAVTDTLVGSDAVTQVRVSFARVSEALVSLTDTNLTISIKHDSVTEGVMAAYLWGASALAQSNHKSVILEDIAVGAGWVATGASKAIRKLAAAETGLFSEIAAVLITRGQPFIPVIVPIGGDTGGIEVGGDISTVTVGGDDTGVAVGIDDEI